MKSNTTILPGSTIGILGSGQLGRMTAIEARKMGYRVETLSPERNSPTGQIADIEWVAAYTDLDAIRAFAKSVDVVTFEFENVAREAVDAAKEFTIVRPDGAVLHTTQHRLREKTFLSEHGFPVTPFRRIGNEADLHSAIKALGLPGVLKTAGFGYDGKGQVKIVSDAEVPAAILAMSGAEAIYEAFVDFTMEVSMVAARGVGGEQTDFGLFENIHKHHILDVTISPARVPDLLVEQAREITRGVLQSLDVVGVLCVEFFVTKSGELLINELAPRPHNSGHVTFDAHATSQFAQQVRSVCGLPLGSPAQLRPAAMVNLLGELWADGTPDWKAALDDNAVKLHLYGKSAARAGRKMGHITVLADSVDEAAEHALEARERLMR